MHRRRSLPANGDGAGTGPTLIRDFSLNAGGGSSALGSASENGACGASNTSLASNDSRGSPQRLISFDTPKNGVISEEAYGIVKHICK